MLLLSGKARQPRKDACSAGLSAPQRVPGEMRGSLLSDMIIGHLLKQLGWQAAEFKALTGVSTSRAREVTRKDSRAKNQLFSTEQ